MWRLTLFPPNLALEEKVQRGPKHGDSRELPDLPPARSDRGAQNIGGQRKFQAQGEPPSQAKPDVDLRLLRDIPSHKQRQGPDDSLKRGQTDDQGCSRLDRHRQVFNPHFRLLKHIEAHGIATAPGNATLSSWQVRIAPSGE